MCTYILFEPGLAGIQSWSRERNSTAAEDMAYSQVPQCSDLTSSLSPLIVL